MNLKLSLMVAEQLLPTLAALRAVRRAVPDHDSSAWAALGHHLEEEIQRLDAIRQRLADGRSPDGRGTTRSKVKRERTAVNGTYGGRPRRAALAREMGSGKDQVARINRAPVRLLRYAQQVGGSDAGAAQWLTSVQPEYNGESPLYADLRLQRRVARSLPLATPPLPKKMRMAAAVTPPPPPPSPGANP
jgi:hypothetical protein